MKNGITQQNAQICSSASWTPQHLPYHKKLWHSLTDMPLKWIMSSWLLCVCLHHVWINLCSHQRFLIHLWQETRWSMQIWWIVTVNPFSDFWSFEISEWKLFFPLPLLTLGFSKQASLKDICRREKKLIWHFSCEDSKKKVNGSEAAQQTIFLFKSLLN